MKPWPVEAYFLAPLGIVFALVVLYCAFAVFVGLLERIAEPLEDA